MGHIGIRRGFLGRLARDVRGNTIAIMAAAMLPLVGLIGGGVDMSRLYLVKTRLQQACDAGALAGRKAMGTDAWSKGDNNNSAEDQAKKMFAVNFSSGAFGTSGLTREFKEADGTVSGTAGVKVPMTIMRVFGMGERDLGVSCTAKMELPNTDVMFVLDVTRSMVTGNKIGGLKSAVKCFYEALLRVGTTEICDGDKGKNDPTATEYKGTAQIRLGFVPYGVNVNVGKLLLHAHMANEWTYQSREANMATFYAWTTGTEATPNWGNWSEPSGNFIITSGYDSFSLVSSSSYNLADGNSYAKQHATANTENKCKALNTFGGDDELVGIQESYGTTGTISYTPIDGAPVHPANTQALSASQKRQATVSYGYRYRWFKSGNTTACWLERASKKNSGRGNTDKYDQTRTGSSSRSVSWTSYEAIQNWTYKPITFSQIAALKDDEGKWKDSISLPIGQTDGPTVKLSGSDKNTTLKYPANVTVNWGGCIEEAKTFQNTDGDPRDEWSPLPDDALDIRVNLVPDPTKPETYWGPMLQDAVWGRYSGKTSNRYFDTLTAGDLSRNVDYYCPNEARKLQKYNTKGDLETYINGLSADAIGTHHDIGLLWGGRFLSPLGIFASENALTSKGGAIQRHLIFMTDGNAETFEPNMTAYGHPFYDRRQTSYNPSTTVTNQLIETRLSALCTQIKNMNITLWVISYGGGVDEDNETRLEACATPGRYYTASNGTALIARFKQIANEIAELRLTS